VNRFFIAVASFVVVSALAQVCPAQQRFGRRDRERGDRSQRGDRDGPRTPQSQPSTSPTTQRSGAMPDEYGVLLQRSIFARSGIARDVAPPTTTTAPTRPPLSPEQQVVFVGVLVQDNEYVAFAENQTTRQLMILRTGDDVARGKVVAITLDTIAYGANGQIKVVHLGQNLAGELASTSFASGSGSTAGSTTAPSGTSSPSSTAGMTSDQAAVLERLRQRRQRGE
jgi:hypothetical protein